MDSSRFRCHNSRLAEPIEMRSNNRIMRLSRKTTYTLDVKNRFKLNQVTCDPWYKKCPKKSHDTDFNVDLITCNRLLECESKIYDINYSNLNSRLLGSPGATLFTFLDSWEIAFREAWHIVQFIVSYPFVCDCSYFTCRILTPPLSQTNNHSISFNSGSRNAS
jgi:hypothetical protein